jgi:uncharacterized iron-regulated protein
MKMNYHRYRSSRSIHPLNESVSIEPNLVNPLFRAEMIEELPQKKKAKNSESLEVAKADEDVTKDLVEQMDRALESDIVSNQNGKPAFQRLKLLK